MTTHRKGIWIIFGISHEPKTGNPGRYLKKYSTLNHMQLYLFLYSWRAYQRFHLFQTSEKAFQTAESMCFDTSHQSWKIVDGSSLSDQLTVCLLAKMLKNISVMAAEIRTTQ